VLLLLHLLLLLQLLAAEAACQTQHYPNVTSLSRVLRSFCAALDLACFPGDQDEQQLQLRAFTQAWGAINSTIKVGRACRLALLFDCFLSHTQQRSENFAWGTAWHMQHQPFRMARQTGHATMQATHHQRFRSRAVALAGHTRAAPCSCAPAAAAVGSCHRPCSAAAPQRHFRSVIQQRSSGQQ
jgi:hypothetical protein